MTKSRRQPVYSAKRHTDAGVTLVEILVVLAIVGVMASVLGLSVSGGSRGATVLEREATLLSVRLERAADMAVLTGTPAGLVWDDSEYSFSAFQDGAWRAHPDGVLGANHKMDDQAELTVNGLRQGQYLIRADMLPSVIDPDTNTPVPLQIAIAGASETWRMVFDGVSASPRLAGLDTR